MIFYQPKCFNVNRPFGLIPIVCLFILLCGPAMAFGASASFGKKALPTDTADKRPLIVVDGVPKPYPKNFDQSAGNVADYLKFLGITADDIARVDVLKQANAVPIYGYRGANGVILVTTKKSNSTTVVIDSPMGLPDASSASDKQVFTAVEVSPVFPGGEQGFNNFLVHNIRYPKAARDSNIQGRVYLSFIVEKDGSLSNIKTLRSPDQALADEAKRVLSISPHWSPGIQNGKPVRVQYTVPINFSLGDKPKQTLVQLPELQRFVLANLIYPESAKKDGLSGEVTFSFVVKGDQTIASPTILRSSNLEANEEILKAFAAFTPTTYSKPALYTGLFIFNKNPEGADKLKLLFYTMQ